MAGIAPSVNNIAAPAPAPHTVPLAEPAAPGITAPSNPSALNDKSERPQQDGTTVPAAAASVPEGAGPDVHPHAPKPVEVTSVPQTPIDNRTPIGGTPRPELNLTEESKGATPTPEAPFILGPGEPGAKPREPSEPVSDLGAPNGLSKPAQGLGNTSAPAASIGGSTKPETSTSDAPGVGTSAIASSAPATSTVDSSKPEPSAGNSSTLGTSATGSSMLGTSTVGSSTVGPSTTGEKRKAEDDAQPSAASATAANGSETAKPDPEPEKPSEEHERPGKKPKLMDKVKDKAHEVKDKVEGKTTNGAAKGKPGRPKKDKKAPPPVGRTQRKTRSQGPVEGAS